MEAFDLKAFRFCSVQHEANSWNGTGRNLFDLSLELLQVCFKCSLESLSMQVISTPPDFGIRSMPIVDVIAQVTPSFVPVSWRQATLEKPFQYPSFCFVASYSTVFSPYWSSLEA